MTRFLRGARLGLPLEAETWLYSLGFALPIISVLLVPTSRLLADDGGGTAPAAASCLGSNGCDAGGCAQSWYNSGQCLEGSNQAVACQWRTKDGCYGCPCLLCFYVRNPTVSCGCQCQLSNGTCNTSTGKCNPN
jgi:hypothetical protein